MEKRYLTYNGDTKQYAKLMEKYIEENEKWKEQHKRELKELKGTGVEIMDCRTIMDKPSPPSKVEVTPDGYEIHSYGLYNTYSIGKITTGKELLAWLRCLSEKTWFDGELCEDFINAVSDQNKWDLPFYFD